MKMNGSQQNVRPQLVARPRPKNHSMTRVIEYDPIAHHYQCSEV
jgi:hypothetical protein